MSKTGISSNIDITGSLGFTIKNSISDMKNLGTHSESGGKGFSADDECNSSYSDGRKNVKSMAEGIGKLAEQVYKTGQFYENIDITAGLSNKRRH